MGSLPVYIYLILKKNLLPFFHKSHTINSIS